jgi:amino acid adenylation domain-containing protein
MSKAHEIELRRSKLTPEQRAMLDQRLRAKPTASDRAGSITRRKLQSPAPLSFAQQRLWFLEQWDSGNPLYNLSRSLRFEGGLNIQAVEKSLTELLRRHEVLRTCFRSEKESLVQIIGPSVPVRPSLIDLSEINEAAREDEAKRLGSEEAERPFNLAEGPLMRTTLVRLGEDDHLVLFTIHHIVTDGWSMGLLIEEVARLYEAFSNGHKSPLEELPIQYADFASWQREWLQGDVLNEQIAYWKKALMGAPHALQFPTDHPRSASSGRKAASHSLFIGNELVAPLKTFSRQEGATFFMTLLAAYQVLLHRYSGQEDILVGSPIAGRNHDETEKLIGCFINTLVLRANFSSDPTFKQLLKQVRERALGAYAHQDLPFERLVEELQPERSQSHTPIFQVMFTMQNLPGTRTEIVGLTLASQQIYVGLSKYEIVLTMTETEIGLHGEIQYNTGLFEESTIVRFANHLQILLQSIAANPDDRVSALPILSDAEQTMLLHDWNQTEQYLDERCVHHLFEDQVKRSPNHVAVISNDERLSYAELNGRVDKLAGHLKKAGIGPDVRVALLLERSVEMVVGLLAVLKAGGAYVPLDASQPPMRLNFMLSDTEAPAVLTQSKFQSLIPQGAGIVFCLDTELDDISSESDKDDSEIVSPDNLAYVIYTSGSTGKPKGAMITHRGVVNYLRWAVKAYDVEQGCGAPVHSPLSFDLSVTSLLAPLVAGRTIELLPEDGALTALAAALNSGKEYSLVKLTPAHLEALAHELNANHASSASRSLVIGGEALTSEAIKFWRTNAPAVKLYNEYGPTETVVGCCVFEVTSENEKAGAIPIGKPIANTQLYVLDHQMMPVPVGVTGELYIGGVGVARGYHKKEELTAERFVPDPFALQGGARLYKTGDLARYMADGNIEYLGRIDHQVKVRGYRVEPGEIEWALRQHPAVRDAIVIVREDQLADKRLVAYVMAREPELPAEAELRAFASERLPSHMIPESLIILESFPLTSNGKIDRDALPAPSNVEVSHDVVYVAPRTPVEKELAAMWSEVLGQQEIGINDNFFKIGGHSLKAIQIVSRIHKQFETRITLQDFFASPTIEGLARVIIRSELSSYSDISRVPEQEFYEVSPAQRIIWIQWQFDKNSSAYNLPSAYIIDGDLNIDALERAFHELVARHEILRTTFPAIDGQPKQKIALEHSCRLSLLDFREVEDEFAACNQFAYQERKTPFDLEAGPLVRAYLVKLKEGRHMFVLTLHHIIADAWSMNVLMKDITRLYGAFDRGEKNPLEPLRIQYKDFAAWQNARLEGRKLQEHREYWREKLGGQLPVLNLPLDYPRPVTQSFAGATAGLALDEEMSSRIAELGRLNGASLFITLLSAVYALLYRYTGQEDILVGSPVAGRDHKDLEDQIGFYLNMVPLRTDVKGDDELQNLITKVRDMTLKAYEHQAYPFDYIVRELNARSDGRQAGLMDVVVTFQDQSSNPMQEQDAQLRITPVGQSGTMSKNDLWFSFTESGGIISGAINYNTDIFSRDTLVLMVSRLKEILEQMTINASIRIEDIEFNDQSHDDNEFEEPNIEFVF